MLQKIRNQSIQAMTDLIASAQLHTGDLVVVGCSTSEVAGKLIGTASSEEVGAAIFDGIYQVLQSHGLCLAAQCCEHLNRALIIEKCTADRYHLPLVQVVPYPKAGGSFATAAYHAFSSPVAVEHITAQAGLDIGGTLIGMHLQEVAVPVRLSICHIGEASILCARTRPKYIGGPRAQYE